MGNQRLRTMDDLNLDGREVLVRVDFNVALGEDGEVGSNEDYRIEAALSTIQELQQRRCRSVLLTHMGSPEEARRGIDVRPVARRLSELLNEEVKVLPKLFGDNVNAIVAGMSHGDVVMLPNVRGDEREIEANEKLGQELAGVAEIYVNEAFSACHRNHTSISVLPRLLQSCAGRRTVLEYEVLLKIMVCPDTPCVAVISGAKVETKMRLLERLVKTVDKVLIGGLLGNVMLAGTREEPFDHSTEDELELARKLMARAGNKVLLPIDVVVEREESAGGSIEVAGVKDMPEGIAGVWDVGPETVKLFLQECGRAKTIVWNGPLGKFEDERYAEGTMSFARGLADMPAMRVVGGGDTVHALEQGGLIDKYDHVSVGGGAMITMLEGSLMPGLEPLYAED